MSQFIQLSGLAVHFSVIAFLIVVRGAEKLFMKRFFFIIIPQCFSALFVWVLFMLYALCCVISKERCLHNVSFAVVV